MSHEVKPFTAFDNAGPMGLWDTSKLSQSADGVIEMTGGSNPDEGFSPYDDFSDQTSGESWFGGGSSKFGVQSVQPDAIK